VLGTVHCDTSYAPGAESWRVAGDKVRIGAGLPLEVKTLPSLAGPFAFSDTGAVLVRPDGHVAWRAISESADPVPTLLAALDAASGRTLAG
jgi:hypothetical protein